MVSTGLIFKFRRMARMLAALTLTFVAGCEELGIPVAGGGTDGENAAPGVPMIERDVEAPEVFQSKGNALWDGRPSLGGVWVAHPDVGDPERVIIRNSKNGKFVIGALFRKERATPGPALQLSSDAALAIDVLAGAPTPLTVTALKKVEIPDPAAMPVAAQTDEGAAPLAVEGTVTSAALPAAQPAAPPKPTTSSPLAKPYVQVGIFAVEKNANATVSKLNGQGLSAISKKQTSQGKTFWRVLVGPAQSSAERKGNKDKVAAMGFKDAYFVKR